MSIEFIFIEIFNICIQIMTFLTGILSFPTKEMGFLLRILNFPNQIMGLLSRKMIFLNKENWRGKKELNFFFALARSAPSLKILFLRNTRERERELLIKGQRRWFIWSRKHELFSVERGYVLFDYKAKVKYFLKPAKEKIVLLF